MKNLIITVWGTMVLCSVTGPAHAQSYPVESEQIEFAGQLLGQSQYQSSASVYEEFIRQFPRSPLLPNAYIGAGDSHFFLKEPEKALEFYQQYENQFPHGKDRWLVLLREAQCFYLNGKTDEVMAKLNSLDPSSLQPAFLQTYYFYLASALLDKGNAKEAGENFVKVIKQQSNGEYTTLSYLRLASILSRAGNSNVAAKLYDSALQSGDSMEVRAQIDLIQGLSFLQAKQYEMAALTFKKVVNGYPNLPEARDAAVNWFIALLKSNQAKEVISEYDQRFKDGFDDPSDGPIHLLAVKALLSQKQNEEALNILNALMNSPAMTQKVKADAALLKAKALAGAGQFNEALEIIDKQGARDKDTQSSLQLIKGQVYLGLHDYDKAWQIFSDTAQKNPDDAATYCDQAHIRHAQGQDAQSASLFMECFNKAKDASYAQDALFSAFLMYKNARMTDAAISASQAYQTRYPQGAHFYEAIFGLAEFYSDNKEYDRSINTLKTVGGAAPYEYQREALFQIAYNLQSAGKGDEALKLYRVIISQNTDQPLSLMSLKNSALIYAQKNDQDKAAEVMDTIINDFPSNDLPMEEYSWLAGYWKEKKDPQRMLKVLAAAKKKTEQK